MMNQFLFFSFYLIKNYDKADWYNDQNDDKMILISILPIETHCSDHLWIDSLFEFNMILLTSF